MSKRELSARDLSYLTILMDEYAVAEFPKGNFVLGKDGVVRTYYKSPQWFARWTNRFKDTSFLELCKIIYNNIMVKKLGYAPSDENFAKLYYEGNTDKLLEVLFLLHFVKELTPVHVGDNTRKEVYIEPLSGIERRFNEPVRNIPVQFADGVYNMRITPITIPVDEGGSPISLYDLLNRVVG